MTHFEVDSYGTLSAVDFVEPRTRKEIYKHIAASWEGSPRELAEAMSVCHPLELHIHSIYADVREEIKNELKRHGEWDYSSLWKLLNARLQKFPEVPEDGVLDWLSEMTISQFDKLVVPSVQNWFAGAPDRDGEEYYFPPTATAQYAALEFFRFVSPADLKTLGIRIVEGEHPASTYYAAELDKYVDEANRSAEAAGIPVRFQSRDEQ